MLTRSISPAFSQWHKGGAYCYLKYYIIIEKGYSIYGLGGRGAGGSVVIVFYIFGGTRMPLCVGFWAAISGVYLFTRIVFVFLHRRCIFS